MMKRNVLLALTFGTLAVAAEAVEITKDWQIVVGKGFSSGVTRAYRLAAEEILRDLRAARGFELPIVDSAKAAADRPSLFLGSEPALKAGLSLDGFANWDNAYAERQGNLYCYGKDDASSPEVHSLQSCIMPTARAVARLLHDAVGVRFPLPGEVGTAVPKREKVEVADGTTSRERPTQIMGGNYPARAGEYMHWIANGIYMPGKLHTYGGHSFEVAVPLAKYAKDHPEYFCLRDGKRFLEAYHKPQPCISNPAVRQLMIDELLRRFDAGADLCQFAQNDSHTFCQCEKCEAMYGTGKDWGEKLWCFARDIALEMKKLRPGKKLLVLSYSVTAKPPKSFREIPDNIVVELCSYTPEQLAEWAKIKVPGGFTVYLYEWWPQALVGFTPRHSFVYLSSLAQRLVEANVKSVYRCGYGQMPALEGPSSGLFFATLADPKTDIEKYVTEWCDVAFGPAGQTMKSFYETLDRPLRVHDLVTRNVHIDQPELKASKYAQMPPEDAADMMAYIYTPKTLEKLDKALAEAEAMKELSANERKRLARVRLEYDYVSNIGRAFALYQAYRLLPTEANFEVMAKAVQKHQAFLRQHIDEKTGKAYPLADWPDTPFLDHRERSGMRFINAGSRNLDDPLTWDVDRMLRDHDYPGCEGQVEYWQKYNREKGLKPIGGWRPNCTDTNVFFKANAEGTAFAFDPRERMDLSVRRYIKLKPKTTYRLSWFVRTKDVVIKPRWRERGVVTVVHLGPKGHILWPSNGEGLTGTQDWQHMSVTFQLNVDTEFDSEIGFRLYSGRGLVAYKDITLEELKD